MQKEDWVWVVQKALGVYLFVQAITTFGTVVVMLLDGGGIAWSVVLTSAWIAALGWLLLTTEFFSALSTRRAPAAGAAQARRR